MNDSNRISKALKPVNDLIVLNAETTGTLLLRQNALFTDMVNASVSQVKTLTSAPSVRDAVEAQRTYLREMGTKVQSTTRENVETLREAGRDATNVLRGAFRNVRDEAEESVDEFRSNVADAVAPEAQQPSAPATAPAPAQF